MKLLQRITGFSRYEQALDPLLLSQTLESQRMRVSQSHRALALVFFSGLCYIWGLWGDVVNWRLLVWMGLIWICAGTRVLVCRYVEDSLPGCAVPILCRNALLRCFGSPGSTPAAGSGYWWGV